MTHPLLHPSLADCRRLFLRNHSVAVAIGAHAFEKLSAQRVLFNVELYVPLALSTPTTDSLAEVVDYDFIRRVITERIARGHIELQETLCDDLLAAMLAHPFAHTHQAKAAAGLLGGKTVVVVLHLQLEACRIARQAELHLRGTGMPRHIGEQFLHHTEHVGGQLAIGLGLGGGKAAAHRNADIGGPVARVPAAGFHQAHVIQHLGAQVVADVACGQLGMAGGAGHFVQRSGQCRRLRPQARGQPLQHQVNAAATSISVVGPARSRINQPTTFTFALSVTAPGAGSPAGTVTL